MITRLNKLPMRLRSKVVKAEKVSASRVYINAEDPDGQFQRIPAKLGDSLYHALAKYYIHSETLCGGTSTYNLMEDAVEPNAESPSCELCYVEIEEPWFGRMTVHPLEKEIIDVPSHDEPYGYNRRLSCCIKVEKWMDEMLVRVPYTIDLTPPGND